MSDVRKNKDSWQEEQWKVLRAVESGTWNVERIRLKAKSKD